MKSFRIRVRLFLGLIAIGDVAAQSLPGCARVCVATTKTKCKSTDYACACSDGNYLPRLVDCIQDACDDASRTQAHGYLSSLCLAVGYPLEIVQAPAGAVRELRALAKIDAPPSIVERQFETGFPGTGIPETETAFFSSTLATTTRGVTGTASNSPATNPAQTTSDSSSNNNNNDNGGGGGGLSTGAKVGIGVGVPLGVGLIAGLIALSFFLGRRSKREQAAAAAATAPAALPQMAGPTGPAELDHSVQYIGHELPTKGNTAEMPAGLPPSDYAQPLYGWPQQGQQQYPQYGQARQYPVLSQQQYPALGQQYPQQGQQPATELPERR